MNKTSSKVTLVFDLKGSTALSESQKDMIRSRLGNRINSKGELLLSCEDHRSQFRNKEEVVERFRALLADALTPPKKRRRTRVPLASRRNRVEGKRKRSDLKKSRSKPDY